VYIVYARYAYALASLILFLALASAIACGQTANSLSIPIPSSYPLSATKGYDSNSTMVDLWGSIEISHYGNGIFISIPTNAAEGDILSFFQDTGTWALFRNDTLVLPIHSNNIQSANLVLITGDLACTGGHYYGQVTGMELDTNTLGDGNASMGTVIYLNTLPERASYSMAVVEDAGVKNAIMEVASTNGANGIVGDLLVELTGDSPDSRNSIGNTIIRLKADDAGLNGNVTAYRYNDGSVSRLPCQAISNANGTIYEAISPGPGIFAFAGPYKELPPIRASVKGLLTFTGVLAAILLLLVTLGLVVLKKMGKKRD
jgi:hypothetical protein